MTIMQWTLLIIASLGNLIGVYLLVGYGHYWLLTLTMLYSLVGVRDVFINKKHTLLKLYPVVGHIRYILESFHDEIHQYFIASNTEERPFNRELRSLVYQRSKGVNDAKPFGTEYDLYDENFSTIEHSIHPVEVNSQFKRFNIGSSQCAQPYSAARFNISAMSFGSLSREAITALNLGAKKSGCYHNTGEGSISPYHLQGADIVWQIGSGLFGCRTTEGDFDEEAFRKNAHRDEVKMIEIKLSQGAKPGHGGVLPKEKITDEIAKVRIIAKDRDCISPAVHPLATSPEKLVQSIAKLRELSGGKPVGFKLCIGRRAEFLAIVRQMLKQKTYADFITVDGAEGGTGAAPVEFSNRLGKPATEGILFVSQALIGAGIRNEVAVIGSGKTASGFHVLEKIALGADVVNAARTMMLALGCIQSKSCHTNACPTGIATQDRARSRALKPQLKSERVANFQQSTLHHFFELVGAMGVDNPDNLKPEMIIRRRANKPEPYLASDDQLKPGALLSELPLPGEWKRLWDESEALA